MKKSNRYKLVMELKARGFVFSEIVNRSKLWYVHREYKGVLVVVRPKVTNEGLIEALDRAASDLVHARRRTMRAVNGGMSWAPKGLSVGVPKGKLRLVA